MNSYAILKWYQLSNITEIIGEIAIDRFDLLKKQQEEKAITSLTLAENENKQIIKPAQQDVTSSFVAQAEQLSNQCQSIAELKTALNGFDALSLKKTALNTFTGVGKEENPLVFCVFDAPKAPADKSGNLFEGPNGVLMQKMLAAIQLSCQNSFIAPLIPWRLPGDRKPTQTEECVCVPFLKKQIELTNPDFILVFGALSTRVLFGIESISKARQQKLSYQLKDRIIPAIVTFGPDLVSVSQTSRKNAWDDLKKLAQLIQEKISN